MKIYADHWKNDSTQEEQLDLKERELNRYLKLNNAEKVLQENLQLQKELLGRYQAWQNRVHHRRFSCYSSKIESAGQTTGSSTGGAGQAGSANQPADPKPEK